MITTMRISIDNSQVRAEMERLRERAEQSYRVRGELALLTQNGVPPFALMQVPSTRRNELRYRAELSDAYWQLLEREAV